MERLWAPWRLEYIQGEKGEGCIFCLDRETAHDEEKLILCRGEHAYVIMNRYPYSNGHLMVSPFRHLSDHADLTPDEVLETHALTVTCQDILRSCCRAEGFNVGWNIGDVAGAGIAQHLHLHIVPRWHGDANFMPVLADVRVIPQHLESTYQMLKSRFDEQMQSD